MLTEVSCKILIYKDAYKMCQLGHDKTCFMPSLRERLCTHKVFTKDQCFYLNYHKFSIKSYVLDVY